MNSKIQLRYDHPVFARMKGLLQGYYYKDAEYVFQTCLSQVVPLEDYEVLRARSIHKQSRETVIIAIQDLLSKERIDDAQMLCQLMQSTDLTFDYTALIIRHHEHIEAEKQRQVLLVHLRSLLQSQHFADADQYFKEHAIVSYVEYATLKAPFLQSYFDKTYQLQLSEEQAYALAMPAHSLLVTARAGSGKTRVLTCKAAYAMAKERIAAQEILILTFNREARRIARLRLRKDFGFRNFDNAFTFHSLAFRLVRPDKRPVGSDDGLHGQSRFVQQAIEKVWNEEFSKLVYRFFRDALEETTSWADDAPRDNLYQIKRSLPLMTLHGETVKSRGEKYIADFLYEHDIRYAYEQGHRWNGEPYRPDFTLFAGDEWQMRAIIEHWALDPGDLRATLPSEWTRTAAEYRQEINKKRDYWKQRKIPLIETSVADLLGGREAFETILKARLEAHGFLCKKLPEDVLRERLRIERKSRLAELFAQFIQRAKQQRIKPNDAPPHATKSQDERNTIFWQLSMRVYAAYQDKLAQGHYIDYNDMLIEAIDLVHHTRGNCSLYIHQEQICINHLQWILVDEFQDLSPLVYELLTAIRHYNPKVRLFAVGDDWQAIYGFAGANLTYFHEFGHLFANAQCVELLTNYRSSKDVVMVSNKVMDGLGTPACVRQNPPPGCVIIDTLDDKPFNPHAEGMAQKQEEHDSRYCFNKGYDNNYMAARTLKYCYQIICDSNNRGKSVVILSRTNKIYGIALKAFHSKLKELVPGRNEKDLRVETVHCYKGLENDIVIIVSAIDTHFPLLHSDTLLFSPLMPSECVILSETYAEEQRLFYVALTRAREKVWVLTEKSRPSEFLKWV